MSLSTVIVAVNAQLLKLATWFGFESKYYPISFFPQFRKKLFFWMLFGASTLVSPPVALYFSSSGWVWLGVFFQHGYMVDAPKRAGVILLGNLWLKGLEKLLLSERTAGCTGVPGLLYGLFILLVVLSGAELRN